MELEEAITKLKRDISKPLACGDITIVCIDDLETALSYIDNSISKEVIEKKVEELNKEYEQVEETSDFVIADVLQPKIQVLQELLEGK